MSFFPPPPPAPPPARSSPTTNYPPNSNGFRGRGRGIAGHHGRGFKARGGASRQPPYSDRESIGRNNGKERSHGHQNGSFSHAENHGVLASGSSSSDFRNSLSMNLHPNAFFAMPVFPDTSKNVGYNEQHYTTQSNVYAPGAHSNPQNGHYRQPYTSNRPNMLPPSHHGAHNSLGNHGGRGQKRGHREAFGRGGQPRGPPKGHAPPAVPSFGGPLPVPPKPLPSQDEKNLNSKKKRKHNQLGLTPKTEEHESSEEDHEDIQDEETRLAAAALGGNSQSSILQVSYKGQTSTLQSPSDIAAWIAERRRKFPTKARVAEAADQEKQREEARRKAAVAQRQWREEQTAKAKEKKKRDLVEKQEHEKAKKVQKAKKGPEGQEDVAAKRKQKVERLRKKLEKEEKRIAEAESRSKRKRSSSPAHLEGHHMPKLATKGGGDPVSITNAACPTIPAPGSLSPTAQSPKQGEADEASISSSDISSTDSEDLTSSSGSVSSDSDSTPEEETSKKVDLKVLPPKREKPKQLCKYFVANGRCRSGRSCRYKHELPTRGSRAAKEMEEASQPAARKERVSLYQRLVEQEQKSEQEAVLRAIIHLGDNGVLDQVAEDTSK